MASYLILLLFSIGIQLCTGHIGGYISSSESKEQQKSRNDIVLTARTKVRAQKIIPTTDREVLTDPKKEFIEPQRSIRDKDPKGDENEGLGIEIGKLTNTDPIQVPDNFRQDTTIASTVKESFYSPPAEQRRPSQYNEKMIHSSHRDRETTNASKIQETTTLKSQNLEKVTKPPVLPPLDPRFRRIFNPDEIATVDEFPFVAALLMNRELWCGAAIIDTDKVITAAHCLQLQYNNRFFREYVRMLTVRVGSSNATAGGEVYRVSEINFHPNYKPESLEFNLVILGLHRNITFGVSDPIVEKIDYNRGLTIPNDNKITFLGWGSVLNADGSGGQTLLQKVELPIYDIADCQEVYGKDLVTRNNFCAGYITLAKNVCNHDAGGPAILNDELVGILSFSAARCDRPDYPAVFTLLGGVADWIDRHIGEKSIGYSIKSHKLRQN